MEEEREGPIADYRGSEGENAVRDAGDESWTASVVEGNVCGWVTDGLAVKERWACRLVHRRRILCSERSQAALFTLTYVSPTLISSSYYY